jgi:sugar diacid utilization regulator
VSRGLPLGSLTGMLDDGLVCALVPDAGAPGRRAEIQRALGRRRAALGPDLPPTEVWRSARRAHALHRLVSEGVVGERLATTEDHLGALVVHGEGGLARELAARRLAPLADRTPASRARLLDTLAAWLDHQGSVPRVAETLDVHPQTVRYRLRQLRELFGERLDDPEWRFELMLALRAGGGPG